MFCKIKTDGSIQYSSIYFNSSTKTGNLDEFNLDQPFQEILYRIDSWINLGSGWIVEEIQNQYVNISVYSTLIGSTYTELPNELKHSRKGLTNIQNNDNKCFLRCHIRHLNLVNKNPSRITKKDKELASKHNYEGINFPVSKKDYCKGEVLNKLCVNVFCYKNKIVYPFYLSSQKFDDNIKQF